MPNARHGMISRQRILSLFDKLTNEKIIYVCAPAGYGKTVLIRQWLEVNTYQSAIISLDEFDNKPVNLCVRFCAALISCQPENLSITEIITHPAFNTAPDEFTLHAISLIDTSNTTILIIDDLHFISSRGTLKLLFSFIKKLPEKIKTVILSRHELPECFFESWMKEQISFITTDKLRFSADEIKCLYEQRGRKLNKGQADEIQRYTGGWAIGIGAMLLSDGNNDEFLTGRLEYLGKFIDENVWKKWSREVHEFMINTSIVTDMTPELCDALTEENNSRRLLNSLMLENVFVTCTKDGIYSYHNLFHNFLKNKLNERGREYSCELLCRAGKWYLSNGDFFKATDCFIRAEDNEGIYQCFEVLAKTGNVYFIVDKLIQIANTSYVKAVAETYPYVYSILSWASFNEGQAEDMAKYADLYYQNQEMIVNLNPLMSLNIILLKLIDFRSSLFELVGEMSGANIAPVVNGLNGLNVTIGIINQNMPFLHRGTRDFSECSSGEIEKNVELMKGAFGILFGEQAELLSKCILAGLTYEQGELEKAHKYAEEAVANIKDDFASESKFCALSILAVILDTLEQPYKSETVLDDIESMIEQDKAYWLNQNFNSIKIKRSLAKGDTAVANDWIKERKMPFNDIIDFYGLYIHLATSRAYIVSGNFDFAIVFLKKILELSEKYKRPLDIIESNILIAIACWKKKRSFQDEALQHLYAAVTKAYDYGFIQIFINEGAEISGILRRLYNKMVQQSFDGDIPASFVKYLYDKALECSNTVNVSDQSVKIKFTEKQKSVIRLMYEGKNHNEIGESLGISKPTVRSHISCIYTKLNVSNQIDAVKSIKKLELF